MAKGTWSALILVATMVVPMSHAQEPSLLRGPRIEGFYVVNLGDNAVTSYNMGSWPSLFAGEYYRTGELIDGLNAAMEGQSKFDFYWQLTDTRVFAQRVDVRDRLPRGFSGDIVFSIHDDHVELSWAGRNPVWERAYRTRDIQTMRSVATFDTCGGVFFEHPVTAAIWADRVRAAETSILNKDPAGSATRLRCDIRSYLRARTPRSDQPAWRSYETREEAVSEWKQILQGLKEGKGLTFGAEAIRVR